MTTNSKKDTDTNEGFGYFLTMVVSLGKSYSKKEILKRLTSINATYCIIGDHNVNYDTSVWFDHSPKCVPHTHVYVCMQEESRQILQETFPICRVEEAYCDPESAIAYIQNSYCSRPITIWGEKPKIMHEYQNLFKGDYYDD